MLLAALCTNFHTSPLRCGYSRSEAARRQFAMPPGQARGTSRVHRAVCYGGAASRPAMTQRASLLGSSLPVTASAAYERPRASHNSIADSSHATAQLRLRRARPLSAAATSSRHTGHRVARERRNTTSRSMPLMNSLRNPRSSTSATFDAPSHRNANVAGGAAAAFAREMRVFKPVRGTVLRYLASFALLILPRCDRRRLSQQPPISLDSRPPIL